MSLLNEIVFNDFSDEDCLQSVFIYLILATVTFEILGDCKVCESSLLK